MKTNSFSFLLTAIACTSLYSQVGINTSNPNATLEVASSKSNLPDGIISPKLTGKNLKSKDNLYSSDQIGSIVYVTEILETDDRSQKTINLNEIGYYYFDGDAWQKFKQSEESSTLNIMNGLTKSGDNVKLGGTLSEVTSINTSATNTIRLSGLQVGNANNGKVLMIDPNNNVKTINDLTNDLSIPTPAIFRLNTTQTNFLSNQSIGGKAIVNMNLIRNSIRGLTYNSRTRTITFPIGIYQIMFIYEAIHNAPNCTVSSYMIDFPRDSSTQRIHNTAYHNQGSSSNHGGTITYTTIINNSRDWTIELGRGQSGNCIGRGMSLTAQSTHLLIYRIGDN